MKPLNRYNIENAKDQNEAIRWISNSLKSFFQILNNGFELSDNARGSFITHKFSSTSTDEELKHNLDYVPTGFIVTRPLVQMDIWSGNSVWNRKSIYLQSSATGTVTVFIF